MKCGAGSWLFMYLCVYVSNKRESFFIIEQRCHFFRDLYQICRTKDLQKQRKPGPEMDEIRTVLTWLIRNLDIYLMGAPPLKP